MNLEQLKARRDAAKTEMESAKEKALDLETGGGHYIDAYLIAYGRYVALDELYEDERISGMYSVADAQSAELEAVETFINLEAGAMPEWKARKVVCWKALYRLDVTNTLGYDVHPFWLSIVSDWRTLAQNKGIVHAPGSRAWNHWKTASAGELWGLWTIAERERRRVVAAERRWSFAPVLVTIPVIGVAS